MNLRDKLKEDTILFPIHASTMEDAIREQLDHLQNLDILTGTDILFSIIKGHEENLPSAAGRGIVYPHATSKEVDELVCILGISKPGVDFNSPDGQLCHLILLTLSPEDKPSEHRKFITRFRTMFDNPDVRSQLLDTDAIEDIIEIVNKWEEEEAQTDDLD